MKTNLSQIGEFGLIDRIRKKVRTFQNVYVGIGDDAALLKEEKGLSLLTMDLMVEGVDFSFRSAQPEEVGRKALAINLSDAAAMGAGPEAALVGLVLPRSTSLKSIDQFYKGLLTLAKKFRVSVVGGDLSRGPAWMISVALFGRVTHGRPVLRSGAKPGDIICVTGALGGAILKKHLHFEPRVHEGKFLAREGVRAMIDVSDGLIQDLEHILWASKVGAKLSLDQIPISKDAWKLAKQNRKRALTRALSDGEDFELLCTVPPAVWKKLERNWKK
ncbi:MAG: thiamine-monophosphate kinase, partial [Candidatus Omnitrophica bacterium]|nr:thiamine-monophosphate kinase [Candidatus Omnitrophota bacterium]